jgi:hypothetical protein
MMPYPKDDTICKPRTKNVKFSPINPVPNMSDSESVLYFLRCLSTQYTTLSSLNLNYFLILKETITATSYI